MKTRLALITEIIAPYRIPVFNALAARGDIELRVAFLSETDPSLRAWQVHKEEIRFAYEVLPSFRHRLGKFNLLLNAGVARALRQFAPQVLMCGGYSYLASWQAAHWAKRAEVPLVLWIESTAADRRQGRFAVEALKRRYLARCAGFVVPGHSAAAYLKQFGVAEKTIFRAPNAIDTDFFVRAAEQAHCQASSLRTKLGLPARYFLNVGRWVRAKGIFDLLDAYAGLNVAIRSEVGLVFVGDGADRRELGRRAAAISPGEIQFRGFLQKQDLPPYYALAEALVFPTHSDTWGFVANEAMACGAPVIASEVAGCVADLVEDGVSGLVVPAHNVERLAAAMNTVAREPELRMRMAEAGLERIQDFSPEACAAGIAEAARAVRDRGVEEA